MAIELRHSGGTLNQFSIGDLGGGMSNYQVTDAQLENIFDNVNRVEIINGRIDYRAFYIYVNAVGPYYRGFLGSFAVPADNEIEIAIEQGELAQSIANESVDPIGLTFFKITDWTAFRMALGQLYNGKKIIIWLKRKVIQGRSGTITFSFVIDGEDNALVISQDFNTTESGIDNLKFILHSGDFRTDESFVGEAVTSA